MNESKQEPRVPSKETSGKEVRESYILCSNLPQLVFDSKQSLHRKLFLLKNSGSTLRWTSYGLANPVQFFLTPWHFLFNGDRYFSFQSSKDLNGEKVSKVNFQANDANYWR